MNLQNAYFSFLGGDGRTPWVRACLEKAGCQVVEISNPKLTHMILPLPAFAANGSITGGEPLAELVARLHPGITLWAASWSRGGIAWKAPAQLFWTISRMNFSPPPTPLSLPKERSFWPWSSFL